MKSAVGNPFSPLEIINIALVIFLSIYRVMINIQQCLYIRFSNNCNHSSKLWLEFYTSGTLRLAYKKKVQILFLNSNVITICRINLEFSLTTSCSFTTFFTLKTSFHSSFTSSVLSRAIPECCYGPDKKLHQQNSLLPIFF